MMTSLNDCNLLRFVFSISGHRMTMFGTIMFGTITICIRSFRFGEWIPASECHGGGYKCHLKYTRFCQLQNNQFYVIDQYKGIGFSKLNFYLTDGLMAS